MGRGKHRTYPEENNSKEKALRKKIKEQEQEIKRLKSELKTLNKVLQQNSSYIKEDLEKVKVENLVENISLIERRQRQEAIKAKKTLFKRQGEDDCPTCGNPAKTSTLPFGQLRTCMAGCGWREVINNKAKDESHQTKET